jgi:hypothetical protein
MAKKKKRRGLLWLWILLPVAIIVAVLFFLFGSGAGLFSDDMSFSVEGLNPHFAGRHSGDFTFEVPDDLVVEGMDADIDCLISHEDEIVEHWVECAEPCYEEADDCYDECDEEGDMELSPARKLYSYVEIIPPACAYVPDFDFYGCYDECDELVDESCLTTCDEEIISFVEEIGCITYDNETAEWDGEEVDDIGEFFADKFPLGNEKWESICTFWMWGEWHSSSEEIGCSEFWWFDIFGTDTCESRTFDSIGTVCETIGWNWHCNEEEITCRSG